MQGVLRLDASCPDAFSTPVRKGHACTHTERLICGRYELPMDAVESVLKPFLSAPLTIRQFTQGQSNPTYFITDA
jgi:hypothetical protein